MPIYEYVCEGCKEHFEVLTTSLDPEMVKCTKCGSMKVKKTISASSFRMNQGGSTIPSGSLSGCSSKNGFS